jgi:hypothetical protein
MTSMNTLKRYTRNALIALVVLLTIRVYWFVPPHNMKAMDVTYSEDGRYVAGTYFQKYKAGVGTNKVLVLLQSREEGSRGKTLAIVREIIDFGFDLGFLCPGGEKLNELGELVCRNPPPDIFYWNTADDTQLSLPVPLWRRADAWLISLFYTLPVLPQNPAKAAE